jgi:hypothetical protein
MLFVLIDTEEEFDWGGPFTRSQTSVRHLRSVQRVQRLFDRYRLRPTYVIDFPVASQPDGYEPLRELVQSAHCAIGAHLHPWVTPPYVEPLNGRNSFAGNLDPPLERAKLMGLLDVIGQNLGVRPRTYKAGRYGIGRSTLPLLDELEFEVDQSVMPHYDFSSESGPSFKAFDAQPFLFTPQTPGAARPGAAGEGRRLLELPCTCAYLGAAGQAAEAVHTLTTSPALQWSRLGGIAARLRVAERLVLSPEGFTVTEMRRVTAALLRRGVRTFTLTFHSPSIEAGHTPYVRSADDLAQFLGRIESYLDYFFGALGGTTTTPEEFRTSILASPRFTASSSQAHGMAT